MNKISTRWLKMASLGFFYGFPARNCLFWEIGVEETMLDSRKKILKTFILQ